jgi:hypothetical protein
VVVSTPYSKHRDPDSSIGLGIQSDILTGFLSISRKKADLLIKICHLFFITQQFQFSNSNHYHLTSDTICIWKNVVK